jgi:hypothetical protein
LDFIRDHRWKTCLLLDALGFALHVFASFEKIESIVERKKYLKSIFSQRITRVTASLRLPHLVIGALTLVLAALVNSFNDHSNLDPMTK